MKLIDLACNDAWMLANLHLSELSFDQLDGIDLHPGNIELAKRRQAELGWKGTLICGDVHEAPMLFDQAYDAVTAFELIEHVADPDETLAAMVRLCAPGGRLYVSTPFEAVERGNLPTWAHVEPKGHVRVFRSQDFEALLKRHGTIKRFEIGPDRVMVAEVAPHA